MPILAAFRNSFKIEELRGRILFTFFILIVFRLGAHIPMPGVDPAAVQKFWETIERGQQGGGVERFFAFAGVFSGGALGNLALFSLGIMPYITASIIMQLMTKVSPTLEELAKEGPSGQRKISQYTRYLAIPICLIQGFFAVQALISADRQFQNVNLFFDRGYGFGTQMTMVLALTAGAMFVMWLGEQITEHGIGNGASVLIMAGIVVSIPAAVVELLGQVRQGALAGEGLIFILFIYVAMIVAIVFVTQAQRRIPIQHAKHFRGRRVWMGSRNYMPLKVNTAGVMPVIFASSLMILPLLLARIPGLGFISDAFELGTFWYVLFYAIMIFFFSYFWTYLFFQPNEMANNLKEYGSFVPGIRPGENTAKYLNGILSRITLCGAAFLFLIAIVPDLVGAVFDVSRTTVRFLGGTGILIVVGVALDVVQKTESYLVMHHYEGFLGSTSIRGRR